MVKTTKKIKNGRGKIRGKIGKQESGEIVNLTATGPGVETDGTEVSISLGRTINLGDFESLRVDVGLKLPTTAKLAARALDEGRDWARAMLKVTADKMLREYSGHIRQRESLDVTL